MRSGPVVLVVAWLALASCAQRAAARVAGDGEFVLELGGSGRSLATSLRNCKVELLPAPEPLAAPVVEPALSSRAPAPRDDDAREEPRSSTKDGPSSLDPEEPVPPEEKGWIEVELGAQETLMDIASKHLGSARRFKEIMALNGFTERDTRRLRPGTRIKVPRASGSGSRK